MPPLSTDDDATLDTAIVVQQRSDTGRNGKLPGYGSCGDVLTQHNDKARTGAATCEKVLSPCAVGSGNFGKLFTRSVDGQVYAQPLYVSNVDLGHGFKNLLLVATMSNKVYAFDADVSSASKPLWTVSLGNPVPAKDYGGVYADVNGTFGVLGTPTVDREKGIIYVVSALKGGKGRSTRYCHELNSIGLKDGIPVGKVTITGAVAGNSSDAVDGVLSFNSTQHIQRPGLLLDRGQVVVAFGSHGDTRPYHGWIMSYDADTLMQTGVYSSTVHSEGGSVWQSGQGIAVGDDGSLYAATANGFSTNAHLPDERAQSLLRLKLGRGIKVIDYFTPANYAALSAVDADFGSCGPTVVPGSGRVLTGGKGGILYNVPQVHLGKLTANDARTQDLNVTRHGLYGAPVYLRGHKDHIFIWPAHDTLRSYTLVDGALSTQPVQQNTDLVSQPGVPGGVLSISTDGDTANTGIVWASLALSGNANQKTQAGELRAYNASNLRQLLWSSNNTRRDSLGNFAKFTPPTIANGRVYMATFSDEVAVYGLMSNANSACAQPDLALGLDSATSLLQGRSTAASPFTSTLSLVAVVARFLRLT